MLANFFRVISRGRKTPRGGHYARGAFARRKLTVMTTSRVYIANIRRAAIRQDSHGDFTWTRTCARRSFASSIFPFFFPFLFFFFLFFSLPRPRLLPCAGVRMKVHAQRESCKSHPIRDELAKRFPASARRRRRRISAVTKNRRAVA